MEIQFHVTQAMIDTGTKKSGLGCPADQALAKAVAAAGLQALSGGVYLNAKTRRAVALLLVRGGDTLSVLRGELGPDTFERIERFDAGGGMEPFSQTATFVAQGDKHLQRWLTNMKHDQLSAENSRHTDPPAGHVQ